MFGIGWSEFLLIAVVLVVCVDPKDIPDLFKNITGFIKKFKDTANEFKDLLTKELGDTNKYIKDLNGEIQKTFDVPEIKK